MASRRQRDERTEFVRRRAAEARGWLARRFWGPSVQGVRRLLNYVIMKLPSSRVLGAIGMPIFLLGLVSGAGWPLTGAISACTTGFQLATTEFPLGIWIDVAVDSQGRFYVVDSFHLRIQRYSPDGEFERGWFSPRTWGKLKVFAVRIAGDDRVIVVDEGEPRTFTYTYTTDGEPLELKLDVDELRRQGLVGGKASTAPYAIRGGLIPRIVDTRTGRTVIATPWPLRLIGSPFPALVYFLIGVAFIGLADLQGRRERPAPPQELLWAGTSKLVEGTAPGAAGWHVQHSACHALPHGCG
jgi:hypothetical protein